MLRAYAKLNLFLFYSFDRFISFLLFIDHTSSCWSQLLATRQIYLLQDELFPLLVLQIFHWGIHHDCNRIPSVGSRHLLSHVYLSHRYRLLKKGPEYDNLTLVICVASENSELICSVIHLFVFLGIMVFSRVFSSITVKRCQTFYPTISRSNFHLDRGSQGNHYLHDHPLKGNVG